MSNTFTEYRTKGKAEISVLENFNGSALKGTIVGIADRLALAGTPQEHIMSNINVRFGINRFASLNYGVRSTIPENAAKADLHLANLQTSVGNDVPDKDYGLEDLIGKEVLCDVKIVGKFNNIVSISGLVKRIELTSEQRTRTLEAAAKKAAASNDTSSDESFC